MPVAEPPHDSIFLERESNEFNFYLLCSFAAPDEAQNTEGLFTVLNEFWASELADILLSRDQLSVGEPLCRGRKTCLNCSNTQASITVVPVNFRSYWIMFCYFLFE